MSKSERKNQKNHTLVEFISILRQRLPELQKQYKVKSLGLFGSYVRGEERKRSDLDVLVEFDDDTLTLFKFIELEYYLSNLVGVKVDLVEKSGLKPRIGQHILEEVVPV
jgi:predicted nucleotidyltransferase